MAKSFGDTKGKAAKSSVESYAYSDGDNTVRMVGGILPRYVYWVKSTMGKELPVECLAFDRDKEKFTNVEHDYVPEYFPGVKCQWAYSIKCIDPKDGKVKVLNLKKKLYEQIRTAAEDLGDPTDPDTGWDVTFKKVKTGPLPFNVEYQLAVLKCKKRPLTEAERAAVAAAPSIDEEYPRPTPDEVRANLDKLTKPQEQDDADDSAREAAQDL